MHAVQHNTRDSRATHSVFSLFEHDMNATKMQNLAILDSVAFSDSQVNAYDTSSHSDIDFLHYFDYYINISIDCIKDSHENGTFLDTLQATIAKIVHFIKLAVGDRIHLLQFKLFDPLPSSLSKSNITFLTFGLIVNNEKAFDPITKGPLANHPDAAAFRDLWGSKSEIRRFQNGDICEAVYWNCETQQQRRDIILNAIKYILNRKLHFKTKLITSNFAYTDKLLELPNLKFDDEKVHFGTGEEFIYRLNQHMITLKKYLHCLNDLSFSVVDVIGIDASLRTTEVFPPFPINSKANNVRNFCNLFDLKHFNDKMKHIKPIKIMLKIEADIKLLNNIEAIQNQKYLFHYELGKAIAKSHNLFVRPTPFYVDIFFEGYVFRVIITLNKEAAIYRDMANKMKAVKSVESAEADQIEFESQVLPAISSCLNLLSKENPSFALTCRLFKRWLSLQMMMHFFQDITLDLLVAYSYLYFQTDSPQPNSPVKGFIRVLKFLSEFDFTQNLLILNFNQSFSLDKMNDIRENFVSERSRLPVIFIVTPYDRKLSQHTRSSPNALIVYHAKKLAHTLLLELTSAFNLFRIPDIKDYMKPNMSMFDMIIQLNTKAILNKFQALDFPSGIVIRQSLYSSEQKHVMPITDFNPAATYLDTLKKAFENVALFFYDEFAGRSIGVLLRPEVLQMRPFKYSTIQGSMLTETSYSHLIDNVALNIAALVEDFEIMGKGLVEKVLVQSDKLLKHKLA